MPQMEWVWLCALIIFAILEAATSTLVSLWFIGGSLTAMIAALCGAGVWLQLLLLFAVSAVLLVALRPLAKKYLIPRTQQTNARRNIGKHAVVTERIPAIDGKAASGTVPDWPAGKYNVILTKENGNWKIKDITLLEWIQND